MAVLDESSTQAGEPLRFAHGGPGSPPRGRRRPRGDGRPPDRRRHARLQRGPDAGANVRGHPARPRRPRSSSWTTCRDETVEIAQQLGLEVIVHRQNRGYGGNQKTCYDAALEIGRRRRVMLHPDYQYDATRIPALVAPILRGRRGPHAGQPLPGRSAGGRDAELEVRLQPLPHRRSRTSPSGCGSRSTTPASGPTPGASSRRSRTTATRTTSSSTRSWSPRSWRPAASGSARSPSRRATSRRRARSASGGAWSTGCPRSAWSPGSCSTASASGPPRS